MRGWLIAALVLAVLGAGAWWWSRPEPITVTVARVERGEVDSSVANTRAGTVKACRRARLAPATGGQCADLPVHEGDRVKTGDLLLAIWNRDLAAGVELARAKAQVAAARARQACILADKAEREAHRQASLNRQRLVSEEVVDQAESEARAQRAACQASRAEADVGAAELEVAQAKLERTRLYAPFPGVIAEINGELGEYITPSPPGIPTPPAVDLIDDSCLYISAPIDEVDAPALRVGMPVCVSLDAFPERLCEAHVRRIAPYVLDLEKQARTVEVEVELGDPAETRRLLAGYSADIEVILDRRENVPRVPTDAVLEGYRVLIYRPAEGRLEERRFEPGIANWEYTEVRSGLSEGEQVVTSVDQEGVKDGAVVTVSEGTGGKAP